MNKIIISFSFIALAMPAAYAAAQSQQARKERFDSHVALEFKTNPLILCEGSSRFMMVAIGWTGGGSAPSEDPPGEVTWQSADTSIVRIADKGEIIAKRAGKTVVTATAYWGKLFGREPLPVEVLAGKADPAATSESGRPVCGK